MREDIAEKVATVGIGSTKYEDGSRVKLTDKPISKERAVQIAKAHISKDEVFFRKSLVGVKLTQVEYDLYLDFMYQFGQSAWTSSSMLKHLKAGRYVKSCNALGESRNVPLSQEAKALLSLINHDGRRIIPQSENAFRLMWEKKKEAIGLSGLHFHDTRHEAITRMVRVRKLPVEVLAKITGHKKIDVLVNTYYNPNAADLVFNENDFTESKYNLSACLSPAI